MKARFLAALSGAATLAALASPTLAADRDVVIRFAGKVGDAPLACGATYPRVGRTSANVTLQDFRLYVSNLRLIDAKGREHPVRLTADGPWQDADVALVDLEDASGGCNGNAPINAAVKGRVAKGDYKGLTFDLGVPPTLNHQDPTIARAPLNVSALSWPWRGGYKFVTIDIETSSEARPEASGFSIHLGSTDCGAGPLTAPPASPCLRQNRPTYRLEAFNADRQSVIFDLAALLAESDVTVNAPDTPAGCMSGPNDDDCVAVMRRLGASFRDQPATPQAWVRAE